MPKPKALTVHFDEDGRFISAEYPDGRVYDYPVGSFYDTPLRNINLLRVETYDILVYDEPDEKGELIRKIGTHWQCRRYCS